MKKKNNTQVIRDLNKVKNDFQILKKNKNLVYLNSAATSLTPDIVVDLGVEIYKNDLTTLYRSQDEKTSKVQHKFENALHSIAKFINCSFEELVPVEGTTDGLNKLASSFIDSLEDGSEIILGKLEHASNILPWIQIIKNRNKNIIIKWYRLKDWTIDLEHLKQLITSKTKLISIAHSYNTTGALNDIVKVREVVGKKVTIIVDAAQSIAHKKIDVRKMDCDFLVFGAHKVLGPKGLGFIYGKKELLRQMNPFNYGGGMNLLYDEEDIAYKPLPFKFFAGTRNVPAIIQFEASINYINSIGIEKIEDHVINLKLELEKLLSEIKEIMIINPKIRSSILFFEYEDVSGKNIGKYLGNENIIVRSGSSCVKIQNDNYAKDLAIRASFGLYNDMNDVNKIFKALKKISVENIKFNDEVINSGNCD